MPWQKLGRHLCTLWSPDDVQGPDTSWPTLGGVTYKAGSVWAWKKQLPHFPAASRHLACPLGSEWSGSFLPSESCLGPHSPCPDCIITSSLPGGRGRKTLALCFLTHPPPPAFVGGFPKPPPDVWATLVPKPAGSPESLGAESHVLQPCVPGPPPSLDTAGPFSLPQSTSPAHTP